MKIIFTLLLNSSLLLAMVGQTDTERVKQLRTIVRMQSLHYFTQHKEEFINLLKNVDDPYWTCLGLKVVSKKCEYGVTTIAHNKDAWGLVEQMQQDIHVALKEHVSRGGLLGIFAWHDMIQREYLEEKQKELKALKQPDQAFACAVALLQLKQDYDSEWEYVISVKKVTDTLPIDNVAVYVQLEKDRLQQVNLLIKQRIDDWSNGVSNERMKARYLCEAKIYENYF